jgi:D-alanyl-lipoteichoic acid acyltransferase DltB (MBOAT superfamily)
LTFSLHTILSLSLAAGIYSLLPVKWRGWFLFGGSVIALYWLQPFLPIRFSGFILPSLTLALTAVVWYLTRPHDYQTSREDWQTFAFMAGLIVALSLLRFVPSTYNLVLNRPPHPLLVSAFIGLPAITFFFVRRARLSGLPTLGSSTNGAILVIVLLFILGKSDALAVGIGRFWRSLTSQDPTIASPLDLVWLGFSYIAFRLIHTLRDRQTGVLPALSLREYITYIIFFPTIIAGPIDRAERFVQDLRALPGVAGWDAARFYQGFSRIVMGLCKKFIIADSLAQGLSLTPASAAQATSTIGLWILLYGYALRLYFDFAGYTDIAIGVGLLFGLQLPENFRRPYQQTSLTAFWQSWHITLSNWVRFYVFSPLSRYLLRRKLRLSVTGIVLISQITTMIVIGLWHGISLNFLVWGLWHGLGLFVHKQWSDRTRHWYHAAQTQPWLRRFWLITAWLLTFHYVVLGWVWFLLPDPQLALQTFARLFSL